jgi:hypothetical protein
LTFRKEIREAALQQKDAAKLRVLFATDEFVEEGPNGRHQCLVLKPMGYSALEYLEQARYVNRN